MRLRQSMTSFRMHICMVTALQLTIVVLLSVTSAIGDVRSKVSSMTSQDMDLIKLYLEEFRLEMMSVKSQLARMARNSKLVRTSLKELRTSKCLQTEKDISLAGKQKATATGCANMAFGSAEGNSICHQTDLGRSRNDYSNIDCPVGFHLSSPTSCYRFAPDRVTWVEAKARCKSMNAHLVALESESEQRFIKNHLTNTRKLQNCDFWTAGTDQLEEGVWVWNTSTTSSGNSLQSSSLTASRISPKSANWQQGEPNNSNGQEHCLLLDWYARWAWNDASCNAERACYVCEIDM